MSDARTRTFAAVLALLGGLLGGLFGSVAVASAQPSPAPTVPAPGPPEVVESPTVSMPAEPEDVEVDVEVETGDEDEAELEAPRQADGDEEAAGGDLGEDVVEQLGDAIGRFGETLGGRRPPHGRLRWDPTWPRYRFDELVLTAGMGLVIVLEEVLPTRTDANWTSVTDLDLEVARAIGLRSPQGRDTLEELSDGFTAALFLWPVAIDSLIYAGLGEGAWDVAWQLSLISLEVFTVNHVLTVLVRLLTRRERPLGRFCREEPGYATDPICADQPPADGFYSDHTSNAFAGAAMVCMYHDVLDLYGNEAADFAACGTAIAAAAATGLFRIMSDYHWVTDVMTGAVIGSLSGILLPWLLHFQGGARPPLEGTDLPPMTFMPMMGPGELGLSAFGAF